MAPAQAFVIYNSVVITCSFIYLKIQIAPKANSGEKQRLYAGFESIL